MHGKNQQKIRLRRARRTRFTRALSKNPGYGPAVLNKKYGKLAKYVRTRI